MFLVLRRVGVVIALLLQCVASSPTALSATPSVKWYGDDGTWSAISIRVGTPPQWLDVMVSTVSSETWVVGPGGCYPQSDCTSARGGSFNFSNSITWQYKGFYDLGVDKHLGNTWYAEYGLDDLTFGTTDVTLPGAIIGSINTTGLASTTQYLLGNFGLGIVPGSFNGTQPLSPISGLVEINGAIQSHSYGYTAGAKYQQKGTPNSLTLGGYDANRFVPHDVSFGLNPSQSPEVYINTISVANASYSSDLLYTTDRVSAVIDSSTPYLWLPKAACDRFAQSLNLIYDDSLNVYTFSPNSSQHDILQNSDLTFTFRVSDISVSPKIVNITLPYAAFDLEFTFPSIPGTDFGADNSSMFYFPLRQAANETQYTIGRAFLQEAYLITDYERNNFSIYQAVHTSDPLQNTSIVDITRPANSLFSGPPNTNDGGMKLSTGALVGIIVTVVVITALCTFAFLFCRRRRRQKKTVGDEKPATQRTILDRIRRRKPLAHETTGDTNYPTEVGADATHERFELPAPLGPAELDSEQGTLDGSTENGSTQDSAKISAYERARRKLERQQTAAAQAQQTVEEYPAEKTEADISHVAHYRPPNTPDLESPLVSPVGPSSGGSLTLSGTLSPVSPGFVSPPTSPIAPPPTYTRINPSNVVYAGRLPNNIQLPHVVPSMTGSDGRTIEPSTLGSHYTENETDLYGSGDTRPVRSEPSEESSPRTGHSLVPSEPSEESQPRTRREFSVRGEHFQEMSDPWGGSSSRRLDGEDLVHVPQPAENRFSWEEERTEGTD